MGQLRCMRISEMNWMMVEEYLGRDDRAVLPLGCTEQHAYLSLSTDSILAERLAVEAAEPLGVPVFPVLAYGITPYFRAFPGTITLRVETYMSVVGDILDAMAEHGFKRILIVNGHGGNTPVQGFVGEWMGDHSGVRIKFHNWWNAPKVWAQVQAIDPVASHASWMENFPWTRLAKVKMPSHQKPMSDPEELRRLDPKSVREHLKDGNYGGLYQRDDEEMMKIWQAGVEETRALLSEDWT
jgi:creatinine amidohydrolase